MNLTDLNTRIQASPFGAYADILLASARSSVDIEIVGKSLGMSKFGGSPDLPPTMQWPESSNGPYRFLTQIDCADLPVMNERFPRSGLLSLFVGMDSDDGKFFWGSPEYIKGFLFPLGTHLMSVRPPKSVAFGKTRAIRFHPSIDLPFDKYQLETWPLKESDDIDAYERLRASLHVSRHYLLGYPSHCSLGYDPTPSADWQSLLTLDSDDSLWWEWHDGDRLMVFIERTRFEQHDFSNLASDAG